MSDHALFVALKSGTRYRLTEWMSYDEALQFFAAVEDLQFNRPVTIYLGGEHTEVDYFAVRGRGDSMWGRAQHQHFGVAASRNEVVLKVWSGRTYADEVPALKAWNRRAGQPFEGRPGGWIYDSMGTPLGQGWMTLLGRGFGAMRIEVRPQRVNGKHVYRYLDEERTVYGKPGDVQVVRATTQARVSA